MMTGLPPVARNTDPSTSHQAAAAIAGRRPSHMLRLLAVYANYPNMGATDEEAALSAGISHQSATKRCADLRNLGLIVPTGEIATSSAGMDVRVCAITAEGRAALASGKPLTPPQAAPKGEPVDEYAQGRADALDAVVQHIDAMRGSIPKGVANHHDRCWQKHPACALTMIRGTALGIKKAEGPK